MGGPNAAIEANGTLTRKRDDYPHQSTFAYKINISEAEHSTSDILENRAERG